MTTEEFKKEMIKLMEKVENSEELTSEEVNYIVRKVDRTSDLYLLFNQNYEIIQNLNPMDGIKAISYKKLHESKNDIVEELIEEEEESESIEDIANMYESVEENVAKMLNEDLENDLAGFVPPSLKEFGDIAGIALTDRALFKSVYEGLYFTINNSGYKAAKEKDPVTGETYYVFKNEADLIDFCNKINEIKEKLEAELLENRTNYMAITATGLDILMRYDELYNKFTDNGRNKDNIDTNSKVILKSLYDKYTKDIQQELEVTHDYLVTLSFTIRLCKNVIKIAKEELCKSVIKIDKNESNSQSEDIEI